VARRVEPFRPFCYIPRDSGRFLRPLAGGHAVAAIDLAELAERIGALSAKVETLRRFL